MIVRALFKYAVQEDMVCVHIRVNVREYAMARMTHPVCCRAT